MINDNEIMKIAEKHWAWVEGLWQSMPDDTVFGLEATEYLYKTAFVHGWKHASQQAVEADAESHCKLCGRNLLDGTWE